MAYTENDIEILFDSNRGVFIPQNFAEEVSRDCVSGLSDSDWATLEAGPDGEWYWEAWDSVLNNAVITMPKTGIEYTVYQNGDVFLIPVGLELPEEWYW